MVFGLKTAVFGLKTTVFDKLAPPRIHKNHDFCQKLQFFAVFDQLASPESTKTGIFDQNCGFDENYGLEDCGQSLGQKLQFSSMKSIKTVVFLFARL